MARVFLRKDTQGSRNLETFCFKGCYSTVQLQWSFTGCPEHIFHWLYIGYTSILFLLIHNNQIFYFICSCMSYLSLCSCFDTFLSIHVPKRLFFSSVHKKCQKLLLVNSLHCDCMSISAQITK